MVFLLNTPECERRMRLKGLERLTLLTKPNACTLGRPLSHPLQEGLLAGPPAFQFYAADWLAGTLLLSASARGAYITMLVTAWEQGPIPDHPTALYRAMGLAPNDPPFEDIWRELQPKWTLTKQGWENDRLERIRASQDDFRKLAAKAGRASGRARRELAVERSFAIRSTDTPTEHERIANSPISDLRSPIFTSDLQSPPPDQERAETARATTQNPHSKPTNLIHGGDLRRHGTHGWCSDREGLCVPYFLHQEFVGKSQRPEPDVKAWYASVLARFSGVPIGEDALVFWRNEFAAWIGTVTATPDTSSKSARTMAGARKTLEHIAAGTLPNPFALPERSK